MMVGSEWGIVAVEFLHVLVKVDGFQRVAESESKKGVQLIVL